MGIRIHGYTGNKYILEDASPAYASVLQVCNIANFTLSSSHVAPLV